MVLSEPRLLRTPYLLIQFHATASDSICRYCGRRAMEILFCSERGGNMHCRACTVVLQLLPRSVWPW